MFKLKSIVSKPVTAQISNEPDLGSTSASIIPSTEIKGNSLNNYFNFDENKWLTIGDGNGMQEYTSRRGIKKNAIKWGQMKLFISELQFLNKYWNSEQAPNPTCVYVGAAPGTHLRMLSKMFPQITFDLWDAGNKFDTVLNGLPNVKLYGKMFSDDEAKIYVGRDDILFISDIRSLEYNTQKEKDEISERLDEEIIKNDMRIQMHWVQDIKPIKALLKFRLPWPKPWVKKEVSTFSFLDGDVYKQVFSNPTTTESRLVTDAEHGITEWNFRNYEQLMFYHNNVVREHVKFINPLNGFGENISTQLGLLEDYDSVVFVTTVQQYLQKYNVEKPTPEQTMRLCKAIIDDVGKNKITFVGIRAGIRDSSFRDYDDGEDEE